MSKVFVQRINIAVCRIHFNAATARAVQLSSDIMANVFRVDLCQFGCSD